MELFIPCAFPDLSSSSLSLAATVAVGDQPNYPGDGHLGSTGVMRERRAADDPYWSYSGEFSFVL